MTWCVAELKRRNSKKSNAKCRFYSEKWFVQSFICLLSISGIFRFLFIPRKEKSRMKKCSGTKWPNSVGRSMSDTNYESHSVTILGCFSLWFNFLEKANSYGKNCTWHKMCNALFSPPTVRDIFRSNKAFSELCPRRAQKHMYEGRSSYQAPLGWCPILIKTAMCL
jgi:hypothetical protein